MIFRPELAKLVRAGKKTMTRRPVKADEFGIIRCRYKTGHSYAVQPGRGREEICRITITSIRQEHLGEITLRDARREGFATTREFLDYWQRLYVRQRPWTSLALDAARRQAETLEPTRARAILRYLNTQPPSDQGCWPALAWQPVWVISFQLGDLAGQPRLLAAVPGPPDGDYTTQPSLAMRGSMDPGEAVTEQDQARITEHARQARLAFLSKRQRELERLPMAERLERILR